MEFLVKEEKLEDGKGSLLTDDPMPAAAADHTASTHTSTISEEICSAIRFSDICALLERMTKLQGSAPKLKLLFNKELKQHLQGQSIFPLLRIILPQNDTERGKYGLKQASLAKTYVAALHLDKSSEDAKRLLNWKDPTKSQGIELSKLIVGDFGTILEELLRTRVRTEPSTVTLGSLNKLLDDLANALTVDDKIQIISNRVLDQFSAMEQKWIVRIIFQDLKIGLKHENVLRYFYPTALKRYNECTNLRTVCEEQGKAVTTTGIQLFVNFSPMLAKGFPNPSLGQVTTVESAMRGTPFVMDLKLDGERILCHIGEDNSFTLFTRKGNDYTDNYWPVAHNIIMSLRKKGNNFSCILDGEICAFDKASMNFVPFGQNLGVAKIEREHGEDKQNAVDWYKDLPQWMNFVIFDIVYIEGEGSEQHVAQALRECGVENVTVPTGEISTLPLIVRRKLLMNIIEEEPHRVDLVPCRFVTSLDETARKLALEEYFNEITLAGREGLVVKNLNSPYLLGEKSRASAYWVKMKPEYGDHAEDLDLLVLAAYYGEGQNLRGEGLSTFLLGVKDDANPDLFQTLCKVGTGYSFEELTELRAKIGEVALPWDPKHPPQHLAHWKISKRDDRPNVYIPVEKSFVMQLKCAEIVDSISFSCGLTCRFPRVQRIRYDKSYRDVLSVSDILAAKNRPRNAVSFQQETIQLPTSKKRGRGQSKSTGESMNAHHDIALRRRDPTVEDQFRITGLKQVLPSGRIFEGLTLCVLENDFAIKTNSISEAALATVHKLTRDQLMKDIKSQGGQLVANPSFPGCLVVCGNKRTVQIKNLIEQGTRDLVDFRYIVDCLDAGYRLPLRGFYFLGICPQTRIAMRETFDVFGDSYCDPVSNKELEKILENVDDTIIRVEKQLKDVSVAKKASSRSVEAELRPHIYDDADSHLVTLWSELKKQSWRSIISQFFAEEERGPVQHAANSLYQQGVIVYFDLFADWGSALCDPSEPFFSGVSLFGNDTAVDQLLTQTALARYKSSCCRFASRGAIVSNHLHAEVTHVVIPPERQTRTHLCALQERLRYIRRLETLSFEKRCVNFAWIEDCIAGDELVALAARHMVSMDMTALP